MIFFFRIDVPDVGAVADTVYDVVYDLERGAHRVVDVVVTVLTVSADTVEVVDAVEPVDQSIDFLVGVEVSGISFFNRFGMRIKHVILAVDHAHFDDLVHSKVRKLLIGHIPELIAFVAEVFQTDPYGMLEIDNHVRRPVVVNLETAELYVAVMDINPVVRNDVADGFDLGLVFQIELAHQNAQCAVITVRKSCRNFGFFFRNVVHTADEIADRHGGNEDVSFFADLLAILLVGQSDDVVVCIFFQTDNLAAF